MIGKVTPEDLDERVFPRTGAGDGAVLQGPAYGEDAAAIEVGGETLVVSGDPISLAIDRIGTLGVNAACNDIAASGADPRWLTVMIFLPDADALGEITRQLDAAARDVGAAIVGGHSEYAPERSRPLLALTCLGLADRFVPTGGARPGDAVLLTGGAGIEGTAILASDFPDDLGSVPEDVLDCAVGFYDDIGVLEAARIVRGDATAMHDPTEGGVIDGLLELAAASDVALEVERDAIPVREETAAICGAAGVDPLRIFGSGALLATVPSEAAADAVAALGDAGIRAATIGEVAAAEEPALVLDGERITEPVRDDLYAFWE